MPAGRFGIEDRTDPDIEITTRMFEQEATDMFKTICAMLMVPVTAAFVAGCDVDVTDTGELPSMDVEPGEAPEMDVRGPDVDVDTEPTEVEVPDVDVETETETLEVPDVDIDVPEENEADVDASQPE